MTDSPRSHEPGAEKRRSTRLAKAVPIKINGTDALGQPFQESTLTVMIDCYGCKYQSTHYAPKDSTVSVEIRRLEPPRPSRVVQARVVWVQRPKTYREVYHVALAFEVPGNVWGIPWPPSDWFPCPGEEETPVAEELTAPDPVATALAPAAVAGTSRGLAAQLAVADEVVLDCTVEMMSELEKSRIRARGASEARSAARGGTAGGSVGYRRSARRTIDCDAPGTRRGDEDMWWSRTRNEWARCWRRHGKNWRRCAKR